MRLQDHEIGGAIVQRAFRMGDRYMTRGTKLTATEVLSMRPANRMSMVDKGILQLWPKENEPGELHLCHHGGGRWYVIEGRKLHDGYLLKEEAEALVASKKPAPH